MTTPRRAIKCINEMCKCIYGCELNSIKMYCRDCESKVRCKIICVLDVSGGLCASCYELKRIQRIRGGLHET